MKIKKQEGKGELTIANLNGDVDGGELTPKQKLAAVIEAYKVSNPAKYELKKKALEEQLKSL